MAIILMEQGREQSCAWKLLASEGDGLEECEPELVLGTRARLRWWFMLGFLDTFVI